MSKDGATFVPLPDPRWYAIHTRARLEEQAAAELARAGYDTYYPFDRVRRVRKKPGGRNLVMWVNEPYFPRYIFIAIIFTHQDITTIRAEDFDCISTVVKSRFTGNALRIPNDIMDSFMDRAAVKFGSSRQPSMGLMRQIFDSCEMRLASDDNGSRKLRRYMLDPVAA